jgi:glycogen synthase
MLRAKKARKMIVARPTADMPVMFFGAVLFISCTGVSRTKKVSAPATMAQACRSDQAAPRPDILHANDWHTALALYALFSRRKNPAFARIRTMLTLHNLPYMGGEGEDVLAAYDLEAIKDEAVPAWARSQPLVLGLYGADAFYS